MKIVPFLSTALFALLLNSACFAQATEILLWPAGAPGSEGRTDKEIVRVAPNGERFFNNIHRPSITAYLPGAGKSSGTAIIIAPGGGHRELRIDNEGFLLAQRFRDKGIAAFVLKYRLAHEANSPYTVDKDELADIQRAIRLVKSRAKEWNIDTSRVGVMGFSAGGELAGLAAMKADIGNAQAPEAIDRYSSRLAFQALIYPGGTKRLEIVNGLPPIFLAAGFKDRPDIAEGVAQLYLKYKQAGIPADLHIYSDAGHGFAADPGSKHPSAGWMDLFISWLSDLGLTSPLSFYKSGKS